MSGEERRRERFCECVDWVVNEYFFPKHEFPAYFNEAFFQEEEREKGKERGREREKKERKMPTKNIHCFINESLFA